MQMIALLLLSSLGQVLASPVGDPLAEPSVGRVHLDGIVGFSQVAELDKKCTGEACSTKSQRSGIGMELGVSVVRGLGLYTIALRETDTVREAHYEGRITSYGGGVRIGVPIRTALWLASTTDVRFGQSRSQQAERIQDPAHAHERKLGSSVLVAMGHPENGGHLWTGVHGAWIWEHTLHPLGDRGVNIDVPLRPKSPVSGVLGGTVISDVVGKPWRTGPRIRVSVEGRLGQEMGIRIATGVAL